MFVATDFIQVIIDNAHLAKARKKIPDLTWGSSRILHITKGTACIMGIAALAACEPKQGLRHRAYLGSVVIKRLGWGGQAHHMKTPCPKCGHYWSRPAQDAVAHINDRHGIESPNPLRTIRRILRQWVRQEWAAAKYLPVRSQRVAPYGDQPPAPEQKAAGESR